MTMPGGFEPRAEPSIGEVYRVVLDVREEQRAMRKDLIGRAEYESDQERHADAHKELRKDFDGFKSTVKWVIGIAAGFLTVVIAYALNHIGWHA